MDIILVVLMAVILFSAAAFLSRWFTNRPDPLTEAAVAGEKALSDLRDRESCIQNMRTRRAQVLKKHGYSMLRECEKGCQEAIESDWTDVMFAFYGYYGERTTNYVRISLQV
ncbi:MAG: hypothetical protein WAV09_03840 [Minisyncoccia bacterium]